jgi:hypothetical protein
MPKSLSLKDPIHGISASHGFTGEPMQVETEAFYTTNDGSKFIELVEMLSEHFLSSRLHTSTVDHLLFFLNRKNEGILYLNELTFIQTITYGKDIQKGEAVLEDHIVDVHRLELVGADGSPVVVPDDCGVIFLFSIGWRKGLYFNFQPLPGPNGNVSDYSSRFGRVYGQLQFQEKTSLDEQQWKQLSEWGWFPFSCLTKSELREIGSWSRQNRFPPDVFTKICQNFKARLPSRVDNWMRRPELEVHKDFIHRAVEAYLKDDYLGTITFLYPRIEGLMWEKTKAWSKQTTLVENWVMDREPASLLLPARFKEYLLTVYFKKFDLLKNDVPLSRHTVGHGFSRASDYTFENATLTFMVFDQMYQFLPPMPPSEEA